MINPLNMQQEPDSNYIFNMSSDKFEHVSARLALQYCGRWKPEDGSPCDDCMQNCIAQNPDCVDVFRHGNGMAKKVKDLGSSFSEMVTFTHGNEEVKVTEYALRAAELAFKRIQSNAKRHVDFKMNIFTLDEPDERSEDDEEGDDEGAMGERFARLRDRRPERKAPQEAHFINSGEKSKNFIMHYLMIDLTLENMSTLVDNGVSLPFSLVLLRPFMTYMCGTCILAKGGPELGNTYVCNLLPAPCALARLLTPSCTLSACFSAQIPRSPRLPTYVRRPCCPLLALLIALTLTLTRPFVLCPQSPTTRSTRSTSDTTRCT